MEKLNTAGIEPTVFKLGYSCAWKNRFIAFLVYHGKRIAPHDAGYRIRGMRTQRKNATWTFDKRRCCRLFLHQFKEITV